jgi:putative membrane protein
MRWAWIGTFMAVLIWSGIGPKDTITWCLEVAPAVLGGIIHCVILIVGGHYTYAEVPLGEWFRELVDGSRNNYDKLGHFAQGFIPAMIARELVIRLQVFNSARWRDFFIISFCLGFSAFYELIEWWVALLSDEAAEAFLGTQGYVWDTQSDMGWALFGALAALVLLGRLHDRQLRERGFVSAV